MSFQGLISGAECAAPANPLSKVLNHADTDRTLQQDRLGGPSSARLHHLPGMASSAASDHDLALARQFFQGNSQPHVPGPAFSMPHHLEPAKMSDIPNLSDAWLHDQQQHLRAFEESKWAAEFGASSQLPVPQNMAARPDYQQRPMQTSPVGLYGNSMSINYGSNMGPSFYQPMNMNYNALSVQDKGKGKSREADFEAAFAQAAASLPVETSRIVEVEDGVTDIEEALRRASLTSAEGELQAGTDFKPVWDQLQNSDLPPPKEDLAKWEAEFNQLMSSQREELDHDYGSAMQEAWENGVGDFSETEQGNRPLQFDPDGIPVLGQYVFETNNKYMDASSSRSLLGDAKALLEQNGSLSEAGLLLEAAIQKGELGEGGYEAWILLGETRNMDEREEAGMRALMEGVRKAEDAGASGAGMLSLAISFTNESYDRASHTMLLRWLRAQFPEHPVPEETIRAVSTHSSWDTHNRITELFLNLARIQHSRGEMNPDVQIALGVLFYTNGEYEHAKDCFESALAARPNDYLLWNRLGSCLSNGSKPEEALGAYREALQLRPTYTRAVYNVGVACLNIGAHREAAEHFLSALSLQERSSGDTSEQLWLTLRRAFLSMDRHDLADQAKPGAKSSLEIFRREGFDF